MYEKKRGGGVEVGISLEEEYNLGYRCWTWEWVELMDSPTRMTRFNRHWASATQRK